MIYKSAVNKKFAESGKSAPANHPVVGSTLKGLARLKGSAPRKVEALRGVSHRGHAASVSRLSNRQTGVRQSSPPDSQEPIAPL